MEVDFPLIGDDSTDRSPEPLQQNIIVQSLAYDMDRLLRINEKSMQQSERMELAAEVKSLENQMLHVSIQNLRAGEERTELTAEIQSLERQMQHVSIQNLSAEEKIRRKLLVLIKFNSMHRGC